MKKRSLLLLIPCALVVAGCGNLKKGSIFTEKFMKHNYRFYEISYVSEGLQKTTLDLGTDIQSVVSEGTEGILKVSTSTTKGLFSVYSNKYVLPLDTYDNSGGMLVLDSTLLMRKFFVGAKTTDGVTTRYVYDDMGNKIFEGVSSSALSISFGTFDKVENKDDRHSSVLIRSGYKLLGKAVYKMDRTLKEVLSTEQCATEQAFTLDAGSCKGYGHPELFIGLSSESSVGTRYSVFDTKKEKYISSFVIPSNTSSVIQLGDYIIYQTYTPVNERETKYDFYDVDVNQKFNFETFRVNYLNGKEETLKTNFVLDSALFGRTLFDEKGVLKYQHLRQLREIDKKKNLSLVERSIIVDEKLNEVADVTGIAINSIIPFGDYYIDDVNNIVYDSKMQEVGAIANPVFYFDKHVVRKNGFAGIVDHTGKFVLAPTCEGIIPLQNGYYLASFTEKTQILKMTDKEEIQVTKEILNTDYTYTSISSSYDHIHFTDKDGKDVLLDVKTGVFADLIQPAETDTMVPSSNFSNTFNSQTLVASGVVYKSGDSYYSLKESTRINYSLSKI